MILITGQIEGAYRYVASHDNRSAVYGQLLGIQAAYVYRCVVDSNGAAVDSVGTAKNGQRTGPGDIKRCEQKDIARTNHILADQADSQGIVAADTSVVGVRIYSHRNIFCYFCIVQ